MRAHHLYQGSSQSSHFRFSPGFKGLVSPERVSPYQGHPAVWSDQHRFQRPITDHVWTEASTFSWCSVSILGLLPSFTFLTRPNTSECPFRSRGTLNEQRVPRPPNTVFMLVQASLLLFYIASKLVFFLKFSPLFPRCVKERDTIHNCFLRSLAFFRCRHVWHVGGHGSQIDWPWRKYSTLQGQSLWRHSRRVNPVFFRDPCKVSMSRTRFPT